MKVKEKTEKKSFGEYVEEVKNLQRKKIEVVPKEIGEIGSPVEISERDYDECIAEIKRLRLIKELKKK